MVAKIFLVRQCTVHMERVIKALETVFIVKFSGLICQRNEEDGFCSPEPYWSINCNVAHAR